MISGIVVTTNPEGLAEVECEIDALEYADVHYTDPCGRLVVTVEARGIEESMKRVEAIGHVRQVLSVSLAQYCLEGGETEFSPQPSDNAVPRELELKHTPHDRRER
jgi:nitrate reductase NapAB chaperone NapD